VLTAFTNQSGEGVMMALVTPGCPRSVDESWKVPNASELGPVSKLPFASPLWRRKSALMRVFSVIGRNAPNESQMPPL
jgi:hypothetical protein